MAGGGQHLDFTRENGLRGVKNYHPYGKCGFIVLMIIIRGFGGFPVYTNANQSLLGTDGKRAGDIKRIPRASMAIDLDELPNRAFVGITISGGGSRAANFGAAVLQELQSLGVLDHAAMISSVSGGSIPAAYYGLHGPQTEKEWDRLKNALRENFLKKWFLRFFYPHNFIRYWITDFDRSDIMAGVFDDFLFDKKQYQHLQTTGPNIIINATDLGGERFVFSHEAFNSLGSRIDVYPLSYAVMASGAFPLVFQSVTLGRYRKDPYYPGSSLQRKAEFYRHLFDGGPTDNLGVESLLGALDNAVYSAVPKEGPLNPHFPYG